METHGFPTSERASFGTRFIAALIDGVIVGVASAVLRILGVPFVGLLLSLGYYTYFEGGESGQTIGKRTMNIRVADAESGGSIGPGRAAVRWLGRLVSGIALGLGYLWMLWDENSQTWHDKMATCVVVPVDAPLS
jgi:uncharacterized RDD family membrane protein YckC